MPEIVRPQGGGWFVHDGDCQSNEKRCIWSKAVGNMSKVLAFICGACALVGAWAAAPYGNDSRSANGRYSVELSRNAEGQLVVAVFQNTNNSKALPSSKAIDWNDPYPGWAG